MTSKRKYKTLLEEVKEVAKKTKFSKNRSFILTSKGVVIASLPYCVKKNQCFIHGKVDDRGERTVEKTTLKKAQKENLDIIECNYCERPATILDHLHPFYDYKTTCEKHKMAHAERRLIGWLIIKEFCKHRLYNVVNNKASIYNCQRKINSRKNFKCCMENCPIWKELMPCQKKFHVRSAKE